MRDETVDEVGRSPRDPDSRSEGTLAIATEAVVGLVPEPKHTVFAVGHFDSTQHAIEATTDALSLDPAQVELMDKTILDLSRSKIEYADLGNSLVGDPAALLFVSFTGDDRNEVARRLVELIALWQANGHGYHILRAVTPAQQGALLKVRKSSLGLLMAASEGANRPLAFVEDTAVSMTVGRDRLFPAVEAEGPDTVVAATGTSCREQIGHGTGREAWHPIELVAQALVPGTAGGAPTAERRRPRS